MAIQRDFDLPAGEEQARIIWEHRLLREHGLDLVTIPPFPVREGTTLFTLNTMSWRCKTDEAAFVLSWKNLGYILRQGVSPSELEAAVGFLHLYYSNVNLSSFGLKVIMKAFEERQAPKTLRIIRSSAISEYAWKGCVVVDGFLVYSFLVIESADVVEYTYVLRRSDNHMGMNRVVLIQGPNYPLGQNAPPVDLLPANEQRDYEAWREPHEFLWRIASATKASQTKAQ